MLMLAGNWGGGEEDSTHCGGVYAFATLRKRKQLRFSPYSLREGVCFCREDR